MDNRAEVREFLTSRRAKITPEQAGMPVRRHSPGAWTPAQRGRRAGPGQRGVLRQARTRLDRRRLGVRPGRHRPCSAARRRGATAPLPPRPGRGRHQCGHATTSTEHDDLDPAPQPHLGARHHHRSGHRPQRSDGSAGQQPSRPGHARGCLRQRRRRDAQLRPVHLPGARGRAGLLSPIGTSPPTRASPSCAPKPDATRTTRRCTTSSASCPPGAATSAAAGAATTSACTAPAASSSITASSATWTWRTRAST